MSELETADVNRLAEDIANEVVGELRKYSVSMNMPDEQESAYYDWSTRIVAMIIRAVKGKRSDAQTVIERLKDAIRLFLAWENDASRPAEGIEYERQLLEHTERMAELTKEPDDEQA